MNTNFKNRSICFFASQTSSSFVVNEIYQLAESFEKVYLVINEFDKIDFEIPKNVSVFRLDYKDYKTKIILNKYFFDFLSILIYDLLRSPSSIFAFRLLKLNVSKLLRSFHIAYSIKKLPFFSKDLIFYSFWFDDFTTSLALLKKRGVLNSFSSYAHGYDLYEERTLPTKKIAYRWFQLKYIDKVYSVSKMGANYLKKKYPRFSRKIETSYLQTTNHGENNLVFGDFVLVTCANYSPVKRLELIPEILENFSIPVTWILIGNNDATNSRTKTLFEKIENVCKVNPLVKIILLGSLSNESVFDFYSKNSVNALLSVSESEGLPVSMMEAASFGIPIISTNVGGCSEIVNDSTGILIEKKFNPKEVANIIMDFSDSKMNTPEFRKGVVDFWQENFSKNEFKFLNKFNTGINIPENISTYFKKGVSHVECKRCLLKSNDTEFFALDAEGICNYCNYYSRAITNLGSLETRKKILANKVQEMKLAGKGKSYDCILGVSGGTDSTYLAYWAKEQGLRPLVAHFDNGWNSELAVKNIERICNVLNFELQTIVINWEEFKNLQVAYLKAGVVDMEVLTDHAIYATISEIAHRYKIKYTLSGFNFATEAVMPKGWVFDKTDWENIKDIYNQFGSGKSIKSYPHINFYKKLYYHWILKLESIQVLNYFDYNKKEAQKIISEKLGWEDYGGKHYESLFTKFYQIYILPNKFGIDKRKAHLSNLICSGQLSKIDAIKEMEEPLFDPKTIIEEKAYILKKLGLSESEFDKIMEEPPKSHSDFKTEKRLWRTYFKLLGFLRFRFN